MHSKRHKRGVGGLLKWLFLCSLTFCLCLSHVSLTTWQVQFGEKITAQVRNLSGSFREVRWSKTNHRNFGSQAYAIHHQKLGLNLPTGVYNQQLSLDLLQHLTQIKVPTNTSQYIHQGINSYVAGDIKDAIKPKALEYLQKSLNIARDRGDKLGEMRLLLNSILLYHQTKASNLASVAVQQALVVLKQLPDSPDKVYAAIDLANLVQFPAVDAISYLVACPQFRENSKALDLLVQAVSTAQRLRNFSVLSFAIGNLGHFYECRQDYQQALKLTIQAQKTAKQGLNPLKAEDRLFLWYWQAGRILKAQNKVFDATKAYAKTCESLKNIRSNIWNIHQYLQVDFRDIFELFYRQFIDLKLSLEDQDIVNIKQTNSIFNLHSIVAAINKLQLVETQSYCVNDCNLTVVNSQQFNLGNIAEKTAIFNSIILEKHAAIIVSFPNGYKKFKWINIDSETLRVKVNKFRIGLENYGEITYNPKRAQKLYDWIIRPFVNDLESLQIKTLVFIQDGILRSVPMAALHDGKKFLVEKYAIATTPSLTLTNLQTVSGKKLRALAVGLTKDAIVDGRRYEALSNVASEIRQVEKQIPGSKHLLDENFTRDRLQAELHQNVYPIVHIATHGEFGNFPEDTFLVTGDNEKLTITELYSIFRSLAHDAKTIDLLTLTACDTAIGDDHAALGLAGVAVQAGVRTALASLWSINDASTVELVTKFYEVWRHPGVSKAEALRQAQQALISNGKISSHPAYWAAFILIGNWL
jgi:CHAT domain-containing protein